MVVKDSLDDDSKDAEVAGRDVVGDVKDVLEYPVKAPLVAACKRKTAVDVAQQRVPSPRDSQQYSASVA